MRNEFLYISLIIFLLVLGVGLFYPAAFLLLLFLCPFYVLGFHDFFQKKHTIRRNFPLLGRVRYIFEMIRPEINQYFIESNTDGVPFSREQRSLVYQRAKKELDTLPFGTQRDVYAIGYEWVNHSLAPKHIDPKHLRVKIGGPSCKQEYLASVLNISAMSYGALSKNAVRALNGGAKDGHFAHNTGEGGVSPFHLELGGDLIWQIGTGYFGCRNRQGFFDSERFSERAAAPQIKMIEIKLSQGAKPGHGGILPAAKVTPEIAEIRGVGLGEDVISPAAHSAFSTPIEMMEFIQFLRDLTGGKPIGFKLCLGKRREFFAICKAMIDTRIYPDFISVDGGEGGTGAAPLEFSNHVGTPGIEALIFVHNALVGCNVRDNVSVFTSGKVTGAFEIIKRIALGADVVYSARGMMMALGCIQALRCNSNECPTGVATQNASLVEGLFVPDKRRRVRNFHEETVRSLGDILGAMGLKHTSDLRPWHIMRRKGPDTIQHYGEIYDYLEVGSLLGSSVPLAYQRAWAAASSKSFHHSDQN